MQQHELTADILKTEDKKSIVITIKESDISFDDIIYLIKYSDTPLTHPFLDKLKFNKRYLSSIDFKNFKISFEFESISQRDYWFDRFPLFLCY